MDTLVRIKRLVIARHVLFTQKVEIEMAAEALSPEIVMENPDETGSGYFLCPHLKQTQHRCLSRCPARSAGQSRRMFEQGVPCLRHQRAAA
jgi:hypothetical protein